VVLFLFTTFEIASGISSITFGKKVIFEKIFRRMKYALASLLLLLWISCKGPEQKEEPVKPESEKPEKIAAVLSQISYCPLPARAVEKYMPGWKVVWNPEPAGGNHAFIATDGHTYIVVIRGSLLQFNWDAFQNWFYQDMNIASMVSWEFTEGTGYQNAKIALGSRQGWQNLNSLIDKITGKSLYGFLVAETKPGTPIIITGHSLGGNLATVYASWLWKQFRSTRNRRTNMNVITFGAPAAGNISFAEDFDFKFPDAMRFENTNDPAAKYPCSGKIAGLGKLYSPSPAAARIEVGYKNIRVPLSRVFDLLNVALLGIELKNGSSKYMQPGGNDELFTLHLSGNNKSNDIESWLNEAYYHHTMEQYAIHCGAVVVKCEE
jgi:triacylglycerol lipase